MASGALGRHKRGFVTSSAQPNLPSKYLPCRHSFVSASSLSIFLICSLLIFFIFVSPSSLYGSIPFLKQSQDAVHFIRPNHGSNRVKKAKSCGELPLNVCSYHEGNWIFDNDSRQPLYDGDCPFQRNAWNCMKNKRLNMERILTWRWVPRHCRLPKINPPSFLNSIRNMNIGFVGDSLNENFLGSFLCILRTADEGAKKWKRKGAWRGAYFPKFNVTVGYHRAVLLARYEWQPASMSRHSAQHGLNGTYRVDVDIPADDWINTTNYYDVFIFNTGHWWGPDKFPKETPLVFYREGKPISPALGMRYGLRAVLKSMTLYIERKIPKEALKIWRTQSPRHFDGGEWNENGSCTFDTPLEESELDRWFDPENGGVNREAREVNAIIKQELHGSSIHLLDLTHLSEFRADAHPAIWLGRKDAVAIYGQDCMHWCLPGLPDTWVDVLSAIIIEYLNARTGCLLGADN